MKRLTILAMAALLLSAIPDAWSNGNDVIIGPVKPLTNGKNAVMVFSVDANGNIVSATGGDATAANQTAVQANAGSDATKAVSVQGITGGKNLPVNVATALPAGTNVVGKVSIDQTTPGTTNFVAANNTQLNGVAMLAGNGVTGTGSPRVTIASDNTAFSVNANAGTNLNTSALLLDATMGLAQASATSGQKGPLVQAAVTTANPSYTTAQTDPLSMTTNGGLRIDVSSTGSNAVTTNQGATGAGTFRVTLASDAPGVQATGSAVNARGFYDTGIATTTNPTNATAGNAVGMMMDKAGRVVTTPGNVREMISSQYTALAANTETTIITGVASEFHDLTDLVVTTAGAAAATLTIKDTTSGTTRFVLNYPNAAVAPGSPLVLHFSPPISQSTAAGNWTVTNSVTTATNITCVYVVNK